MKSQIRILGIDDSPFRFTDKHATVIGVVMRGGEYIECVLQRHIQIDGNDATLVCKDMIKKTRYKKQLRAIFLDGIALGGFNVVNIEEIYNETNIPIITITRDKPDFEKIKKALKKNFNDWDKRFTLMKKGRLYEVKTKHNPIYVKCAGIDISEAKEIIKL